eukprot:gnl/TRDRNA2_/TRDRNA2_203249_c0_seq1.p2 gnl/TRDRNA2_/TRDRNA2_203249_c0~~gnl/TRDRNA2_/TRDRNA2_203249_c0_seq1.p2  ORF type:complete len:101 (+),score=1.78 gnl/TRDRNA2_/TRDRNA2_203249_c0_seq1:258-560(+)
MSRPHMSPYGRNTICRLHHRDIAAPGNELNLFLAYRDIAAPGNEPNLVLTCSPMYMHMEIRIQQSCRDNHARLKDDTRPKGSAFASMGPLEPAEFSQECH